MTDSIVFTKEKLSRLRKAYREAKQEGEDTFVFEGHVLLVSYAEHMIRYLQTQLRSYEDDESKE